MLLNEYRFDIFCIKYGIRQFSIVNHMCLKFKQLVPYRSYVNSERDCIYVNTIRVKSTPSFADCFEL